jgi:ribonuclease HII
LVAAAVILPADFATDGIDDSKRLGPAEREEAFERIMGTATAVVSIRRMRPATIDRRGLHRCNLALLRKAVEGLEPEPDYVLTDGFPVPGIRFPALGVKKGDAVSATVAAASILAKVTRDRVMDRLARTYPEFGFDHNRGYGTPDHLDALDRLGPTPEHRLSFSCVGQPKLPGFAPLEIATQLPPDGEVVPA